MTHPRHHAIVDPCKPAAIMSDGRILTYAELESRSNQVAQLLRRLGIGRGDAVAIYMENDLSFFEVMWGCQRAGVFAVPVSARLLADELRYIVEDSDAVLLIASSSLQAAADAATRTLEGVHLLLSGGGGSFDLARAAEPTGSIGDESPGTDMVYSSGTTGRPKGIRPALPEGAIDALPRLAESARANYGMDERTVYLSPAPLYHAAPLRWTMAVQRLGGTVIVMDKFDAEEALRIIDRHRVTHAQFVPTHFSRLLALPETVRSAYDCRSLQVAIHAAAPCPRAVKEAMMAWWGPILYEFYAGSEGNGVTIATPQEWLAHPGTVGKAVGCEVHICDEQGEPLPKGSEGTVYFAKGATFEYHKDAEKTAASRNRHGWSTLGDVGRLNDDGFLFLTDRKNFMIISGGVNIYPQEIENALLEHPAVADAAVVPSPHPDLGEQVTAVIQPVDWSRAGPELAAELREYLRGRLSPVKVPRRVDFLADMPRLPTGKLMKRLIKDAYFGQNPEIASQLVKAGKA